jgi:hypothetical protein
MDDRKDWLIPRQSWYKLGMWVIFFFLMYLLLLIMKKFT